MPSWESDYDSCKWFRKRKADYRQKLKAKFPHLKPHELDRIVSRKIR